MSFTPRKMRTLMGALFTAGVLVGVAGTGIAATLRGSLIFPDVPAGSYYDTAIGEMYNLGIIKGYDNGNFGPDDTVTRGQVAVLLQRFRDEITGNGTVVVRSSSSSSSSRASSVSSVVSSSSSSSTGVIPPQGTLRFTAATYPTAESSAVQILVVRTGGAKGTVTVDYKTVDGTAVAGTDFTAKTGTLSFANNETSKSFALIMTNNPLAQGNKSFTVVLSNVTNGATLSNPSTATITIQDNQSATSSTGSAGSVSSSSSSNPAGVFNLSALAYMVNEKSGSINVTVLRDEGTTGTATVAYGTSNGTANSGSDYTSVSGTLTFNAGETSKTVNVPVYDNANITGNKAFNFIIGSPTGGASLGTVATAPVTIFDDESAESGSGTVKFAKTSYNVSKSSGYIDIPVQRTGAAGGTVTVNYTTTPLSASAGVDYTNTSGTLTFIPGEATKKVRVYVFKTSSASSGKTFAIDLSGVTGNAVIGSIASTTITIDN